MKSSIHLLFFFLAGNVGTILAQSEDLFLVDGRDGQTYKTVRIGEQIWMAENLNYGKVVDNCQQTDNGIIEKTLYENDTSLPKIYGGLYTWNQAMNWQRGEGSQGICPDGWYIPSLTDWQKLVNYLGADSAGQMMKVGKDAAVPWDGNNRSGFSAIPSGVAYQKHFGRKGHWAVYWSSSEVNEDYAWFAQLDGFWYPEPPKYKILYLGNYYLKDNAFSIRCVRGDEK